MSGSEPGAGRPVATGRPSRIGLLLAAVLSVAAAVPALDVAPDETGSIAAAAAVAVLSGGIALVTLALLVPAWRGVRWAQVVVAVLQLVAILPSLPAFLLPGIPTVWVVATALSALLNVLVFALILSVFSALLLHTAAVVVVVAVYAGLVAAVSAAVPAEAGRTVQTIAAIAVALLFQPVLAALRRAVGRAVYGGRGDPASTALAIHGRLGEPAAIVEETRRALRLPRLALTDGAVVVADSGDPTAPTAPVPLDGRFALAAALRPGERRLHPDDRAALVLVGTPLARLLHAVELTEQLRAARAATLDARERERTALHRELHDGLGPLLTGAVLRADAADKLLATRPEEAAALLTTARQELRTALHELRGTVYGLRPLELEEHGLWAALRRRAAAAAPIEVHLSLPDAALPPAVEVAVFRITSEALTNVRRHSGATCARVEITVADEVVVRVTDDGAHPGAWSAGTGLTSIRHRADELGGTAELGPTPSGGVVRVVLPLAGGSRD
ncbi:sensor histidine kinase [Pseudonocardia sp. WMMC193]|uniref:sensor histidine kinase n=1 Tax=Pseudonocardia sp. WMMC193 TaxID=2911965 RepID=UPI001F29A635|nr:sensor histidine kinase [Pseudonocardia sp. WMMC193]MCF7550099.1 sensor histidine kinase [Pseudonocardia sp. WMMC193]